MKMIRSAGRKVLLVAYMLLLSVAAVNGFVVAPSSTRATIASSSRLRSNPTELDGRATEDRAEERSITHAEQREQQLEEQKQKSMTASVQNELRRQRIMQCQEQSLWFAVMFYTVSLTNHGLPDMQF